jgi:hypothetical protein
MPILDGFGLLAYVLSNFPDLPVIVMTAYGTPELEKEIKSAAEGIVYLEKPVDFDLLVQTIESEIEQFAKGYLKGITLAGFLQIIEIERKSGALFVKSAGKKGYIYFSKGRVINAETGNLEGEPAFFQIVSWEDVEIEVQKLPKNVPVKIKTSLQNLIMEAMRIKDESHLQADESLTEMLFSNISDLSELKGFFIWDVKDGQLLKSYVKETRFENFYSFLAEALHKIQSHCEEDLEYVLFRGECLSLLIFLLEGFACGMVVETKAVGRVIYKMTN